jgi:hypothetical protein
MEKDDRASRKHRTSIPQATKQWFLIWWGPTATAEESLSKIPDFKDAMQLVKRYNLAKISH